MNLFTKKAVVAALALVFSTSLFGQLGTLSVQGVLKKTNDEIVDDGPYDLMFRLYTVATGGTPIWTETQESVPISGGIYSVQLGSVTPMNVAFDVPYFLGVAASGKEMLPRLTLSAAPYALAINGATNKFPSIGNVGINSTTPATTLDANGSISTSAITTSAAAYTVSATDHVIFLDLAGAQAVMLPAAADFPRREIILINKTATAKTVSSYTDLMGAASTEMPKRNMIKLRSIDGEWRLTDGPAPARKALVYCHSTAQSVPNNTSTALNWTEVSDATNSFSANTFTAPRSNYYRIDGLIVARGTWTSANRIIVSAGGTCQLGTVGHYLGLTTAPSGYNNKDIGLGFGADIYMQAGQTINFNCLQGSGNALNVQGAADLSFLNITEQ